MGPGRSRASWRRPNTLVAVIVVAAAALVPLFGDPRSAPVTHPLWARLLLRALEMDEAVRASARASQVFATLAWRDSISLSAKEYLRADGLAIREQAGVTLVGARETPAEVSYALAVVQPGDYRLRARLVGARTIPVTAEITPLAGGPALRVLTFTPPPALGWVFGGATHLDAGAYAAQFLLPPDCSLARIEIAPPCLSPIEPPGGWKARAVTSDEDVAVTALRALDAEHELPAAASPIEITGAGFLVETPREAVTPKAPALARSSLEAGGSGLRASASFEIRDAGLYSFFAFGAAGAGQRWLLDGCRKAVVCSGGGEAERWRPVLSQALAPGRHLLTVALGADAALRHVRIELKRQSASDYVATLGRLGLDLGPKGAVTRERALAASSFVHERRRRMLAAMCGDPVVVEEARPAVAARSGGGRPAEQTRPPDVTPAQPKPAPEPPIVPPYLPPQPPATPTLPEVR